MPNKKKLKKMSLMVLILLYVYISFSLQNLKLKNEKNVTELFSTAISNFKVMVSFSCFTNSYKLEHVFKSGHERSLLSTINPSDTEALSNVKQRYWSSSRGHPNKRYPAECASACRCTRHLICFFHA